jgi:hypothetical protein
MAIAQTAKRQCVRSWRRWRNGNGQPNCGSTRSSLITTVANLTLRSTPIRRMRWLSPSRIHAISRSGRQVQARAGDLLRLVGRVDLKAERTRDALHVVGAFT